MDKLIKLEIVYALPYKQTLLAFSAPENISLNEAIDLSGILQSCPEINLAECSVGVFGKRVLQFDGYNLQEGDRIEIYRPLQVDPKEARRRRAGKVKNKKT